MEPYNEVLHDNITLINLPEPIVNFCLTVTETLTKLGKNSIIGTSTYCAKLLEEPRRPRIFNNGLISFFKSNFSNIITMNQYMPIFEFKNVKRKEVYELIAKRKINLLTIIQCNNPMYKNLTRKN